MSNTDTTQSRGLHRIVVAGGGAGGLELAVGLGRRLGQRGLAKITLVDRNMTHLWKPLLHEVAAGTLYSHQDEISYPAQARDRHFHFRLGAMERLDRSRRTIGLAPGLDDRGQQITPPRELAYDTLVIAIGSVSNDFGIPGVAEHCHFLDHREQAQAFHRHMLRNYYSAQTTEEAPRSGQLRIAVAGAGATGVELAAELHSATRHLVSFGLDRIDPDRDVRITLIEASERILPMLTERLSSSVQEQLASLGIETLPNERIVRADAAGFYTEQGQFIPAELKVWAAGIQAPPLLAELDGLESNSRNQLLVHDTLQTTRDADIFAFGDCAACPQADGEWVPPRAQAAHQQAAFLARALPLRLKGRPMPRYRYRDYGSLINMSRYGTVGNLMGNFARKFRLSLFVEGWLARFFYFSLYKMHQSALLGAGSAFLLTCVEILSHRLKPRVKLH